MIRYSQPDGTIWYCEDDGYPVGNVRGRGTTKEDAYKHWRALVGEWGSDVILMGPRGDSDAS